MDAYLVPLVASVLAAVAVAGSLGAVRIGRWWRTMMQSRSGLWSPRPGIAPDTVDVQLPGLAYRILGAALFVGFAGILLFASDATPSRTGEAPLRVATALALGGAWWIGRARR